MKNVDKWIVAAAIVVAVAVAGYFAYTQFFQQTPQEKVLIIARTNKPSSLDPAYIVWTNDYAIGANIYSTLIGYKPGTREMYGDLAESWEVSENGTVYIFHLRKGVKFHKGYGELKASDVKFTFERILDPKTNARYPDFFKSIDHIEVIDDYTMKFVLKYPDSAFLTYIAPWRNSFIVSQKAVEELGKDFSFNPVGTGPYMFESWDSETGDVVLVANPDYYGEKPKVDKVIYKVIEDPYTAYLALERGEVDIVTLDTSISGLLERAKSNPNVKVYEKIGGGSLSITFNLNHPILKDVRVRRAIAYAINKTEIVQGLLKGTVVEAKGFLSPAYIGYTEDVPQYPYDPEKAKQLLAEAGYPNGFEIDFYTPSSGVYPKIATIIQAQLAKVGIKVNIRQMDFAAWLEATVVTGKAELSFMPLGGRPPESVVIFTNLFSFDPTKDKPTGINFMWYDGLVDLLKKMQREPDLQKRIELYRQAQVKIMQDLPLYPIYWSKVYVAAGVWVKNFNIDDFNSHGDWLEYVDIDLSKKPKP